MTVCGAHLVAGEQLVEEAQRLHGSGEGAVVVRERKQVWGVLLHQHVRLLRLHEGEGAPHARDQRAQHARVHVGLIHPRLRPIHPRLRRIYTLVSGRFTLDTIVSGLFTPSSQADSHPRRFTLVRLR
eukprot:1179881-Prorocentrum_minimum.AAC.1